MIGCYGDINWIKTFLIPNMEDIYNRRLCINDRDFPIGVGLSNYMIDSIESSPHDVTIYVNRQ
jgi:hypothetical protein